MHEHEKIHGSDKMHGGLGIGPCDECAEADRLAHEIALNDIRGIFEAEERFIEGEETVGNDEAYWVDTEAVGIYEPLRVELEDELRYLELRGMLERHPTRPNLIKIPEDD